MMGLANDRKDTIGVDHWKSRFSSEGQAKETVDIDTPPIFWVTLLPIILNTFLSKKE
jgi:hypothetical protein